MQPTRRQVPPSSASCSMQTALAPSCAARIAAVYPPGPPPRTATSHSISDSLGSFGGNPSGVREGCVGPLQVRPGPEPLEDLSRLREQGLGLVAPVFLEQPLGVLEASQCEPKWHLELSELRLGGCEACLFATLTRPEPVRVRLEQRWSLSRPQRLDDLEQLVELRGIAEREGSFERL